MPELLTVRHSVFIIVAERYSEQIELAAAGTIPRAPATFSSLTDLSVNARTTFLVRIKRGTRVNKKGCKMIDI